MSYQRLAEALLQGRPYFGPALRSLQGLPGRHRYILPIVQAVAKTAGVEILEIGSWAGASAISWAFALKKLGCKGRVTCVDAWLPYFDPEREKTGHYERMTHAAQKGLIFTLFQHNVKSSGLANMIEAKVGKSRETLPKLRRRGFHVVYLDGSHTLEDVSFDLREAKRLVRAGGIVCGDDLELQVKDLHPAEVETAARSGQDYLSSSNGRGYYHPGVTLAVFREFGEVSTWDGFWAVRFTGKRWEKVTLDLAKSELPEHVASATIKVAADTPSHYLISSAGGYFALAKQLGSLDIATELLGDADLPPLIFTGDTLEEVQKKIQGVPPCLSPQLVGSYRGFNLVRFNSDVYGLRVALGEVDLSVGGTIEDRFDDQDAFMGDSLDAVKARIDTIEAARALEQPETPLPELRKHNINA